MLSGRYSRASTTRHAIVVLPPGRANNIQSGEFRRWLSRGTVTFAEPADEVLNRVLPLLHHETIVEGLAGLRFWGQTGERSAAWMAGADPVHLETMLNDLRLHAIAGDDIEVTELRILFADLQKSLGEDGHNGEMDFARIASFGYLRSHGNLATAKVSAEIANGCSADRYMPAGATSETYHRLLCELQMSLHEHDVNNRRESAGKRAINSLWLWGGGVAPEKDIRPIMPLFSNEPLFKGYWESCTGVTESWDGEFERCFEVATGGFVVITPDVSDETRPLVLAKLLGNLRQLLRSGRISKLTLLFRDGLTVQLNRHDMLKFWRSVSPLIEDDGA